MENWLLSQDVYVYKYDNCRCSEDTQSDWIELSNFNIKLKDRAYSRMCGTLSDRRTAQSDGNFFRVTFVSNDVYDATGFQAKYKCTDIVEGITVN